MDFSPFVKYAPKLVLLFWDQLKKFYARVTDSGFNKAFKLAATDWSEHALTSGDMIRLWNASKAYTQDSTSYEDLDLDTRAFIDCFKKRLSEQPAAYNYLMLLRAEGQEKSEEQNLLEHHRTQESVLDLKSRMEGLNMAPQYIRALLKELPLEQGLEHTELSLEEMLTNGRIHSEGAKRLVVEFVRFLFEHTDKISEETKLLREAGDSYLAETLEDIKRVLTGESEQSLTAVYEKHQQQAKQNEIRVLKELIEAAQIQFSFGEARDFYERLIELAPTIEHHFNYAGLLYSLNDFKIARKHYEKVLHTLRESAKQDPEVYKPDLARTLNNFGILLRGINELKQARSYYEVALQIYQELGKKNPEMYTSEAAMVLNNLGVLLRCTNEFQQAQDNIKEALQVYRKLDEKTPRAYKPEVAMALNNLALLYLDLEDEEEAEKAYQEAHDIYQDLASHHPRAYEIDYAQLLVMGFNLLGRPKEYLEEAKEILGKYSDHPKAQELLSRIEELGKR